MTEAVLNVATTSYSIRSRTCGTEPAASCPLMRAIGHIRESTCPELARANNARYWTSPSGASVATSAALLENTTQKRFKLYKRGR